MPINQIRNMTDFVAFFLNEHQAIPPADPTDLIELIGTYDNAAKKDALTWDIWVRNSPESAKYPFLNDKPTLMLYNQGQIGDSTYSSGIAFPINTASMIKEITIDETKKEISIKVNKNSFFWRYSRQDGTSIKKVFRNFINTDFTIENSLTNQMDSQTPSHTATSQLDGGHGD